MLRHYTFADSEDSALRIWRLVVGDKESRRPELAGFFDYSRDHVLLMPSIPLRTVQ